MNAVVRHMVEEMGVNHEQANILMAGWEVIPIRAGETVVGHIAKQGSEIHTVLFPEYRGGEHSRAVIRAYRKLIEDCVFLTTRIPLDDDTDVAITERAGFREIRRDAQFKFYWLDGSTIIGGKKNAPQTI